MSKLSEDFQSQLEEGQYVLEYKTEYFTDTISGEETKLTETHIRVNPDGSYKRNHSDVQQFNISVAYASVDRIDYEPQVDQKLAKKIEASTQESISKQQLITAKQEALTEKARGQRLIAKTEATEESAKIEAVIRAKKEKEVAEENLIRDQARAKSIVALKRAEAEGDKLKVAAGLSPLEKANIEKETRIAVAKELAKVKVPQIVVSGGNNGGANPMDALGIKMLMDISKQMSK